MPDGFVGSFPINVSNATNPTLGQNGQGVCGVTLNFDHEYIGDLSITLTSPAGQTVTLVGPIGFFGMTDGSSWDITFLPCADPVTPDPGFSDTWNNNQPWGLGGMYTGSYYPRTGCLENFNTGPVNGTWTLTVTDGQANDMGNFYDYEIIFCDPDGIQCFSCAANAGNLTQPDVTGCEGSPTLDLNLPPTYTGANVAPPAAEYEYTYVIAGAGGVILDYDPGADLSSYPPGTYTVCGFSYLAMQAALIPPPDGTLTVTQLRNMLNSGTATFCGDVGVNCVNATINPAPPDEEEFEEVCAPACVLFHGTNYCNTGDYTVTLTQNGCTYSATLHLKVNQPTTAFVTEQICEGSCSANPNFPNACTAGLHTEKITNAAGCDSTITLNLTVLTVTANIANTPEVPCGGGSVQLQGTGSSVGGYIYQWTAANGGNIVGPTNLINANVNAAGDYQLKVCRNTIGGIACCDSAQVTLTAATDVPPAPGPINGMTTLCMGQSSGYNIIPVVGASNYTWTTPPGVTINSGATSVITNITWGINTGGEICVSANNGCGPSDTTCISIGINSAPAVGAIIGPDTICAGVPANYSVSAPANATGYTWTITAPAQIASGQGTNAVSINWNGATAATICASASNTCGAGPQQCKTVVVTSSPAAATISGNAVSCAGATGTYSVSAVTGASAYNWTVTGGTIVSGNGTSSVQITWAANATSGQVCVNAANTCGTSPQTCFDVMLGVPPPQPVIAGPATLCAGDTGVYTINSIAGATGYTWQTPTGSTILSGQNTTTLTVVWDSAPGGNLSVSANSTCGTGPQVNYPVTVNAFLTANAGPDQTLCGLNTTLNGSVSGGQWSQVSGTGTSTFGNANTDTTSVTVSQNGLYTYRYTLNNAGCVSSEDVNVTFNNIPVAGIATYNCNNTNEYYTVTIPITGGTAPFQVSNGSTTNGPFISDSILSGVAYTFQFTDVNGCQTTQVTGSFNCNCATNAGQMTQTQMTACVNATVTAVQLTQPTLDGNDVGAFILHEGNGVTLVNPLAQNTTGVFGFLPGMTFGQTYYISYVVGNDVNGQPDPQDPCLSVSVGQPVIFYDFPIALAGTDAAVCGDTIILAATGAGVWSLQSGPAGETVQFGNVNSAGSIVTPSFSGTYTLTWTVTLNGCTSSDQVQVTFNSNPSVSNIVRTCDPTNQFFTVSFDIQGGAGSYLVNNAVVAGSSFTSTPFNSGQTYNFQVSDTNGCEASVVTGAYSCNCSTDAGTMSATPLKACEDGTVQASANNDAVTDGNDVIAYILHDGSGTTAGTIFDQNSTGVFGLAAGMVTGQTYYISRVVGNPNVTTGFPEPTDPCFAVAAGQEVVFLEIPKPDAGVDNAICGNTIALNAVATPFVNQWSLVTGPGSATFAQDQNAATTVDVTDAGTYIFRWTATNDICTGFDEMEIIFNEFPTTTSPVETCNNTNTAYSVSIDISGGQAPYMISGLTGSFAGNAFTTDPIPNNTTYNLTITDANGCTFGPVNGIKNCNCLTDAGSMNISPLVFCAGDTATAVWNNDGQLDGDDAIQFVLHTGSGSTLGQVIATAASPSFAFDAAYQTGQIYYISAIAGNATAGNVDVNDPCFSLATGTPVKWKKLPTGEITGDAAICAGSQTTLTFSGTGDLPLRFIWTDGISPDQTTQLASGTTVTAPVNPTETTTYTLIQIVDGTLPACTVDLEESVIVTVNQTVEAGTATLEPDICAEDEAIIDLKTLLTSADPGGTWLEVSASPALPGTFNAATGVFTATGQQPGTYKFRYKIDAADPCPDDEVVVTVNIRPQPKADAGPDQTIDCITTEIILGGPATTTGSGIVYSWQRNGVDVPDISQNSYTVTEDGIYQLSVKNVFGCTATDEAIVSLNNGVPEFAAISQKDINCFGRNNGFISVDSVINGTEPYLFSLNGGPFKNERQFGPLSPGVYTIEVMDINGCTGISDSILIADPLPLTVDLGPDMNLLLGDSASVAVSLNIPSTAIDTIVWAPLFDAAGAGTLQQNFQPIKTASIDVLVKDTAGCAGKDQILIFVDTRRHVYVPNIFEPSGSGINVVTVYGGGDVERVESFRIFDRWGDMMFESTGFQPNDETMGWNGSFKNKAALPGVYVWTAVVLFKDGLKEQFNGDVLILR